MLITLHMFSLSVVCTLNTPTETIAVLRRMVNGNFILTPTVFMYIYIMYAGILHQGGKISGIFIISSQ